MRDGGRRAVVAGIALGVVGVVAAGALLWESREQGRIILSEQSVAADQNEPEGTNGEPSRDAPLEERLAADSCWREEIVSVEDPELEDRTRDPSPAEAVARLVAGADTEAEESEVQASVATSNQREHGLRADEARERVALLSRLREEETRAAPPEAPEGVATSLWTVENDEGEVIAYARLYEQPGGAWVVDDNAVRLSEELCAELRRQHD